ncbi:MAG: hypothetical protein ABH864_04360 [archaeon]
MQQTTATTSEKQNEIAQRLLKSIFGKPLSKKEIRIEKISSVEEHLEAHKIINRHHAKKGWEPSSNANGRIYAPLSVDPRNLLLVAKRKNQIIGSVSITYNSPEFGLPIERTFEETNQFNLEQACEFGDLAIDPEIGRRFNGNVSGLLMQAAFAEANRKKRSYVLAEISPGQFNFYTTAMAFYQIGEERGRADSPDDKVIPIIMNLKDLRSKLKKEAPPVYQHWYKKNPFFENPHTSKPGIEGDTKKLLTFKDGTPRFNPATTQTLLQLWQQYRQKPPTPEYL